MNKSKFAESIVKEYELLFDNSPLGICITDIDGSITVNNTFSEMVGYTRNELINKGWNDIIHKDDINYHNEMHDVNSIGNNGSKKFEKRLIKKDGSVIWTEVTSKIKNDNDGNPAYFISIIRDILDYKNIQEKLKQNEVRYKELFDNNPNPMWLYDPKTLKFLMVNDAATVHYGYSQNEFLSMTIKDIRPEEDIPILMDSLDGDESTINESSTYRHIKKNGEIILVKISAHNLRLNGYNARVIMALDVTEKVAVKQNLVTEIAKLKSIIESTSDVIFSLDRNYCYTSFNSTHAMVMKKLYKADIELGKTIWDYQSVDEDRQQAKINIDKALTGERVREISISGEDTSTQKYFEVSHNPIKDENGEVIGVSVFAKDITDQKKSSEKVKQLSKAVEQSPVTIIITDTEGDIQYVNPKGLELTGYTLEELLNKNPRILGSGERSKLEYRVLWNTIKDGDEWKGEFHNKKKNGELYWELATISPIKNEKGEIINFLAVKEDITERKQNELELIEAKEKAEEINKIKSVFFSNMSHELRTPLVAILGFADILSSTIKDESDRAMAVSILQGGKRLLNTLTSLLNLSELETLKENIELNELDVNLICKDLLTQRRANTKKPNIKFTDEFEEESLKIYSNFRMLKESLAHLLNNAETFTEEGFILIKTYKNNVPGSDDKLGVIEVIDTGVGIPVEKLNVVFEEFRQASEGFARNYEGIGLGLTLTKKYVELMGGSISVVSEKDTGTKFTLSFPIIENIEINSSEITKFKSKEPEVLKPGIGSSKSIKNRRILIVEDDEMNKLYLKKCFVNTCAFECASTGEQAVKFSSEQKFDLILMDINLGRGINGITAVQVIRQIEGYEHTPIVAMTAYASNEAKQEFLSKGCSHFISKPFLMKDIVGLVTEIFSEIVIQSGNGC